MKGLDDCEWLLESSRDEALAVNDFAKKTVRTRSVSSVSEAGLYRNAVLAVLQEYMTMDFSRSVF